MARQAWTLALALLAFGALAPAALGATETKITVTTMKDVDAAQASGEQALRACGSATATQVNNLEETANKSIDAQAPTTDPVPTVKVTPCSFRLALLAARANATPGTASDHDTIVFDSKAFDVQPNPALQFADRVPLTPVTESYLQIDGCAGFKTKTQPGPCVNVKLPENDALLGLFGSAPGSVLPEQSNGLAVLASHVSITGLAFHNGNPAIWVPPAPSNGVQAAAVNGSLSVTNSDFGLDTTGKLTAGGPVTGILLSGDHATIGGSLDPSAAAPARPIRNVFAQGDVAVLIAGASQTKIEGNWFGTGPDGKQLVNPNDQLETGVKIVGLGTDATLAADEMKPLENIPEANYREEAEDNGTVTIARANRIGAAAQGAHATSTACDGPCNLFAAVGEHAIDIGGDPMMATKATELPEESGEPVGAQSTKIQGNQIGVDIVRASAGSDEANVLIRNGTLSTTIGGASAEANEISNSRFGPGVGVEEGAGQQTKLEMNTGSGNAEPVFDLAEDGPGNPIDGPNGGVQAPEITGALPDLVSGTAAPGRTVRVYLAPGTGHSSGYGDIESFLGTATANPKGDWSLPRPVTAGRLVTATVDGPDGTSELAKNAVVVAPPAATVVLEEKKETGETTTPTPAPSQPAPPPPPADEQAPTVVSVVGQDDPQPGKPIEASTTSPIRGQVADPSGIREVRVAIALPSKKKARAAAAKPAPRCNFVHIKRVRIVKRPCSKPLYFKARGRANWKLPLKRKTQALLTSSKSIVLYLRVTDKLGNVGVSRYRIKFADLGERLGA